MFRASKYLLAFLVAAPLYGQTITLGTQTKGILPNSQGGTGANSSAANGCPKVVGGTWTFSSANCSGGGSTQFQTNGVDNGSQILFNLVSGDGISLVNSGGIVTVAQAPLFNITSFTGLSAALEVGASQTNPSLTASYTSTPISANVTNTDGISSPTVLTTPFTSGTITGTFTHHTSSNLTYTLNATGPTFKTSGQVTTWRWRTFVGAAANNTATSATASSTNAVLNNSGGTIGTWGLGVETGTYSGLVLSSQYICFITTGAAHTFSVNGFPTTFTSTTFSFTNQNGDSVSMTAYFSPVALTGTYTVVVS